MSPRFHTGRALTAFCIIGALLLVHGGRSQGNETVAGGATPSSPVRENILGRVPDFAPNGQRVLLLMIDGLAARPFEAALAAGDLPHLSRLLNSRPSVITEAISTFPSATSPSVPELLSGRFAEIENLNAPGAVHAFDREQRRVIRYVTNPDSWQWPVVTLFDATRDLPAVTVFEGRWDGPKSILTQFSVARQAVLEVVGAHNLAEGDRGPVEAFLKSVRGPEPPAVSFVVLNDFDMAAHFYGPESEQAHASLVFSDRLLGQIVDTLASIPGATRPTLLEETNIIVFGDHGQVASGRFVDLAQFFEQRGLKTVDVSTITHVVFRERLGSLWTAWPDVILVSGGSNVTQVYLKNPSGVWRQERPAENTEAGADGENQSDLATLAADITEVEGVGQVIWQPFNGETHIAGAGGRFARILERPGAEERTFAYVVGKDDVGDPFGYLTDPGTRRLVCHEDDVADACYHTQSQWFDQTFDSRFPAAVPLVPKAFHPRRFTGDLMITLEPGYSFLRNQRGDHGNLERDAIITPLVLNGPAIKPGRESHHPKLVDLYPSVTVMLGADPGDPAFDGLDGRVLDSIHPPADE